MKVPLEGFSIREYVSQKRSEDVKQCWPFDDKEEDGEKEVSREKMMRLLPPMEVRKSKWSKEELDAIMKSSCCSSSSSNGDHGDGDDDERKKKVLEVCLKPLSGDESGFVKGGENLGKKKAVLGEEEEEGEDVVDDRVNVIDCCLGKVSKKGKKPKKRSIADIFAVSPQIEMVEQVDEDDEGEGISANVEGSKSADSISKPKVTMTYQRKSKRNKEKKKDIKAIAKKDKNNKLSMTLPASFSVPSKLFMFNKKLEREINEDAAIWKRKLSSQKKSSKKKKLNNMHASKLISKQRLHKPPVFPVHSILKKQTRTISSQKMSKIVNLEGVDQTKNYCARPSKRHVRFSGEDDILGALKKRSSFFELPRSPNIQKEWSGVLDNASKNNLSGDTDDLFPTRNEISEVNGRDKDVVVSAARELLVKPVHEKNWLDGLTDHADLPAFANAKNKGLQGKGKGLLGDFVGLAQDSLHCDDSHFLRQDNSAPLYNRRYTDISKFLNSSKEGSKSNLECHVVDNVQGVTDKSRSQPNPFVDSLPKSAPMSSLANISETSKSSLAILTKNTEPHGRLYRQQGTTDPSTCSPLEYLKLGHFFPEDLVSSISSSEEWKRQKDSICRNMLNDDDYIGLPLNSLGELIHFHSSGQLRNNQLKKQDTLMNSSSTLQSQNFVRPPSSKQMSMQEKRYTGCSSHDQNLDLFPDNDCSRVNPTPLPAKLGTVEMKGSGRSGNIYWNEPSRVNCDLVHQLSSDMNLMNLSCRGFAQSCVTSNGTLNEKLPVVDSLTYELQPPNQPTMRLMGKDVTVGRSSDQEVQVFEDGGRIWTDKEIITEYCPTAIAPSSSNLSHYRPCEELTSGPVSQKAKEIVCHPFESQHSSSPSSFLQVKSVDPRPAHSSIHWQHSVSQTNTSRNHSSEPRHFVSPPPCLSWMSETCKDRESFFSENGSLRVGSHIPEAAPGPHIASDHMLSSPGQTHFNKSLDDRYAEARYMFPVSRQECAVYGQQSSCQSSSKCLLDGTHQEIPTSSQPYYDASAKYQTCSMSGARFLAISSPYRSSMTSYTHPKGNYQRVRISSGSNSHPPLIPVPPGFRRTFPVTMSYKKGINAKDGSKSKNYHLNHLNHVKKAQAQKRSASKPGESARPVKKLNWEVHDSSAMLGLNNGAKDDIFMQSNSFTPEPDARRNKANDIGYSLMEAIEQDGLRTSHGESSSKFASVARSGPTKLIAVSKHISKSNQDMDRDCSRPIHSTIPFGTLTDFNEVSKFHNKAAQMYRF